MRLLPKSLVNRIAKLVETFAEVLPDPLEKWVADFSRDLHPESEVRIWEAYAVVYKKRAKAHDTLERKREVLSALLTFTTLPLPPAVSKEMDKIYKYRHLRRNEVKQIHGDLRRVWFQSA